MKKPPKKRKPSRKTVERVLNGMATIHAARFVAYEKELSESRLEAQQLRVLCVVQRLAYIQMTVPVVRDLLAFLDASSFGGYKAYRCLTPMELQRLEEIRQLVAEP